MQKNKMRRPYRWEECYAKLVLEHVFSDQFYQLELADKPDLQSINGDVGIEVTTAVHRNEKEKDHLFSLLIDNQNTPEQISKNKERIRQLGGLFRDEGVMISWVGYRDLTRIYTALDRKLKKLNDGGYRRFSDQCLFITDTNMVKIEELNDIDSELRRHQDFFDTQFDSIFLYLFGGSLIQFDMQSSEVQYRRVDNFVELAEKAFMLTSREYSQGNNEKQL